MSKSRGNGQVSVSIFGIGNVNYISISSDSPGEGDQLPLIGALKGESFLLVTDTDDLNQLYINCCYIFWKPTIIHILLLPYKNQLTYQIKNTTSMIFGMFYFVSDLGRLIELLMAFSKFRNMSSISCHLSSIYYDGKGRKLPFMD